MNRHYISYEASVLEQDTEPQDAPDGQASALHGSSAAISV